MKLINSGTYLFLALSISIVALVFPAAAKMGLFLIPQGEFEVVAMRRASDAAGGVADKTAIAQIGDRVSFGKTITWLNGRTCDKWSWQMLEKLNMPASDPMLSDVFLGPLDGTQSSGDKRLNQVMRLRCSGTDIANLTYVDRRVILSRSPSGLTYYVLAKPLSTEQILALQKQLKSMKFLDGSAGNIWDQNSIRAVAAYAEYRGAKFRFINPVISENLLDGLDIPASK